jgi:hypothetical protein
MQAFRGVRTQEHTHESQGFSAPGCLVRRPDADKLEIALGEEGKQSGSCLIARERFPGQATCIPLCAASSCTPKSSAPGTSTVACEQGHVR